MKTNNFKKNSLLLVLRVFWRFERGYLVFFFLSVIVSAILPILYVYYPKTFIQALLDKEPFSYVLKRILEYGVILLILNLLKTFFENRKALTAQRFAQKMRRNIGQTSMSVELSQLESVAVRQSIQLANNTSSIIESLSSIGGILSSAITIAGLAYIISLMDLWCILSIVIVTALNFIISIIKNRYTERYRKLEAGNIRVGNYVNGLSYRADSAKEIRANNLQLWIMKKVRAFRGEMLTMQYKDFARYALFDAVTAIAITLQSFVVMLVLTNRYNTAEISIATFTMVFSAVLSLTSTLSLLGEQVNRHKQKAIVASDYLDLLALANMESGLSEESSIGITDVEDIVFDHVSFSYPGCNAPALNDICLKIAKGEKIVLVGLNGSGKSTLIKLLCRFYSPTSGTIYVNGRDIQTIPLEEYRKLIASVFQDFSLFAFSIAENVSLNEQMNEERIKSILSFLNVKYADTPGETYNTKIFSSEGVELSGGEAQKVAIARAIYKNARVLILDEPTASLDMQTEADIYDQFVQLSKDKTTVFISHRLACVCIADKVAVFKEGKIVESGTHPALMAKKGLYYEMYTKQSSAYIHDRAKAL